MCHKGLMRYEEPVEYVPAVKSQSVVWKICRNLAVFAALTFGGLSVFGGAEYAVSWLTYGALICISLLLVGTAFRR